MTKKNHEIEKSKANPDEVVLLKCDWGHDDYSLEIKNLPEAPETPLILSQEEENKKKSSRKSGKGKSRPMQLDLFDSGGEE